MDNIDVDYAKSIGKTVINTPAASSISVAELVFAHLFSGVRFLAQANRAMPLHGDSQFNDLKKQYAKGLELKGKTIGILGFGRIGREVAKIAFGLRARRRPRQFAHCAGWTFIRSPVWYESFQW